MEIPEKIYRAEVHDDVPEGVATNDSFRAELNSEADVPLIDFPFEGIEDEEEKKEMLEKFRESLKGTMSLVCALDEPNIVFDFEIEKEKEEMKKLGEL